MLSAMSLYSSGRSDIMMSQVIWPCSNKGERDKCDPGMGLPWGFMLK